jgi:protein-S-isoprenylcysteine O-methyltransferase Ste14
MKDKSSEIMTPLPSAIQRVSSDLKWAGNIGFWVQLVLGVVSLVTVLFSAPSLSQAKTSQGTGFGIFSAVCGLIVLAVSIYFSFRYTLIARMLQNPNTAERPRKADTLQVIRMGLIVNLVGMLLTIIGAEAIVGIVLLKALTLPTAGGSGVIINDPSKFVNPLDLLIVQANTNTIAAHFAGIVTSLSLLNRITK